MRTPRFRNPLIGAALAFTAVGAVSAHGAIGVVTDFSGKVPAASFVYDVAGAPDGSIWIAESTATDGSASLSLRARRNSARARSSHGTANPYARMGRLAPDGTMRLMSAHLPAYSYPVGVGWAGDGMWMVTDVSAAPAGVVAVRMQADGTVDRRVTVAAWPAAARSITAGPDGRPWVLMGGASAGVARIDVAGTSASPILGSPFPIARRAAAVGRDAFMYVSTGNTVAVIAGGVIGAIDQATGSNPMSAAAGADGSLWWTPNGGAGSGTVVRQGAAGEPGRSLAMPSGTTGFDLAIDPLGNAWILTNSNLLARVSPSGEASSYVLPFTTGMEGQITAAADGTVWVATYPRGLARVLTGAVPQNTAAPVASGRVAVGEVVTATPGAWTLVPGQYSYSWQRCADGNSSQCTDIPGANAAAYAVTASDAGMGLRVMVSAANASGTSGAVASNVVTAESAPSVALAVGRATRRKYVITTRVTVPGPGSVRQVARIRVAASTEMATRRKKARTVAACAPRPVIAAAAGTVTVTCTLTKPVRALLRSKGRLVTLDTTFAAAGGGSSTSTQSVRVPRIRK